MRSSAFESTFLFHPKYHATLCHACVCVRVCVCVCVFDLPCGVRVLVCVCVLLIKYGDMHAFVSSYTDMREQYLPLFTDTCQRIRLCMNTTNARMHARTYTYTYTITPNKGGEQSSRDTELKKFLNRQCPSICAI